MKVIEQMKQKTTAPVNFDQPQLMSQKQLEIAWLGSIFCEPFESRKYGICGLDQNMFEDQELFLIGLEMIRDENFIEGYLPNDSVIQKMMNKKLHSLILLADNKGYFLPCYYRIYSKEIESRFERLGAEWF